MKTRWHVLAFALLLGGLVTACGGKGGDNIFQGAWVSAEGTRIEFGESDWSDSDGDRGGYSFTGEYPEFILTFTVADRVGQISRQALFLDRNTMDLCPLVVAGPRSEVCLGLVRDRSVIPN